MRPMDTLEARLRAAGSRVRAIRALEAAVWGATGAASVVAVVVFTHRLSPGLVPVPAIALLALLLVPVAAALVAASRPVAPLQVLAELDRSHALSDLLSSAWALARLPDLARGPLVSATLARAQRAAASVDVQRSFPWRRPRGLGWLAAATAAAAVIALLGRPQPTAAGPAARREVLQPFERLVSAEQLVNFRARLARLDTQSETARVVRAELDRILDELSEPADRLRVLRRLGELERRARAPATGERVQLTASRISAGTPAPARSSDSTLPPTAAEPSPAREHSQPLAPAAPAEGETPPQVARAPEAAPAAQPAARSPEAQAPQPQSASEQERGSSSPDPADARAPQPERQNSSPPAANEARPVAASASRGGQDDNGPRGPDLERNRVPQQLDLKRGEDLADAIAELRDIMRRDQSVQADLGDPGRGPQPARDRSADPNRDDSQGNRPGAPNAAYASGGPPQVGSKAGDSKSEDVPQLPAAATRVSGARSVGPVRSQVIYGAAQRGFAGGDYARVHAEYENHAERELEREAVPPGYRGYVRRYFEAIAPRKTQ